MIDKGCIHVCLSTDKSYLQHAGVVIASILHNAAPDDILKFYILKDEDVDEKSLKKLYQLKKIKDCEFEFISPPKNTFELSRDEKYRSRATYFRLQLFDLLPLVDRVIYLDCDVIVFGSLQELWQTSIDGYLVAGTAEYYNMTSKNQLIGCKYTYFNAGVLLMNLAFGREKKILDECLRVDKELGDKATLADQDILNVAIQDKRLILPLKWNIGSSCFKRVYKEEQYYSDEEIIEAAKNPMIAHFTTRKKPWAWYRCRHVMWFEYYKILKITPWRKQYYKGLCKDLA